MYLLNITDDYKDFINCTNIDKDDIKIYVKYLLLSTPEIIKL